MSATGLTLAPDAAMVLGIASTAMPFARTREDEAERWLRLLRLHGEVGIALQALGVSEVPLPREGRHAAVDESRPDAVAEVTEHTVRIAAEHRVHGVGTTEVLMAVMEVYGEDFDQVLRAHGTDSQEVLERLGTARRRPSA
ncbi:MAG: hypothetical protein ACYDHN_08425 [Solirubrobacteraceae bacterium]